MRRTGDPPADTAASPRRALGGGISRTSYHTAMPLNPRTKNGSSSRLYAGNEIPSSRARVLPSMGGTTIAEQDRQRMRLGKGTTNERVGSPRSRQFTVFLLAVMNSALLVSQVNYPKERAHDKYSAAQPHQRASPQTKLPECPHWLT